MVDVNNKKCASGYCLQRANPKYDKNCALCFITLFPKDERSIKAISKSRELTIIIHLIHRFKQQFEFVYNKPLHVDFDGGRCSTKRRLDLRVIIYITIIALEIHEDQLRKYVKTYEGARYDDLFMDFSGKYIFIWFNLDSFD